MDTKKNSLNKEQIRSKLTNDQYRVAILNGTEAPFANKYWDNKKEGIYVDIVSGTPLFSSKEKYDSGSGWPSFYAPLYKDEIIEVSDTSHGMVRIEVRSKTGDIHLGHLFDDGPPPTNKRYCINSASLQFIAREDMENQGYGNLLSIFD